jgi:tetratricopeptide (TPR) repeat protein
MENLSNTELSSADAATAQPRVRKRTNFLVVAAMIAALCAITLVPYLNSFDAEFIFDSEAHVKYDPRLRMPRAADPFYSIVADARDLVFQPEDFKPFARMKSWFSEENRQPFWGAIFSSHYWHCQSAFYDLFYRPLVTFTYYLNFQALGYGEVPKPDTDEYFWLKVMFHGTNWAIHLANVLLMFSVGLMLLRRFSGFPPASSLAVAFIAAALFAVHPVQTESVTNIVGRADLLALFFVLTGLLCHIRARDSRGFGAWLWMSGAALALLFGLLAKESAIILVALAGLYDVTLAPRPDNSATNGWREFLTARRIFGYAAFAGVMIFFFTVRALVLAPLDPSYVDGLNNPLVEQGLIQGRLTALKVLGKQLWLLIFPWRLSPDYSYNAISAFGFSFGEGNAARTIWESAKSFIALGVFGGLGFFAWKMRRSRPLLTFLLLAMIGTMIPTSNLLLNIGTIMAERFLYLPSVWFCLLVAFGIVVLPQRIMRARGGNADATDRSGDPRLIPTLVVSGVMALFLVVVASVRTFARNIDWRTTENLWRNAVLTYPESAKTHVNYANSLHQAMVRDGFDPQKLEEAIAHSEQAWAMKKYATFGANLGAFYILKGDKMVEIAMQTRDPNALNRVAPEVQQLYQRGLQVLLEGMEDEQRMVAIIHELLRKKGKPLHLSKAHGNPSVFQNIGSAFLKLNDLPNAERAFRHAVNLEPFGGGRMALAEVLLRMNRQEDAAIVLLEALLLDARNHGAAQQLNQIYAQIAPQGPPNFTVNPATGLMGISSRAPAPIVFDHLRAALLNVTRQLAAVNEMPLALQFRTMALAAPYNAPRAPFDAVIENPVIPRAPKFFR